MAYTRIDHSIARMRFRAALPHIGPNSRVCDLGCGLEAAFLHFASDRIVVGVGVDDQVEDDPVLPSGGEGAQIRRVHADITSPIPLPSGSFDHVTMLAVLEHLPNPEPVFREAFRLLVPAGSLVLTWPSGLVDPILNVLHTFHFISDEMESDEHQKRRPVDEIQAMLRTIGFRSFDHRRFEFGLNNLMVAYKPESA